FLRAAARQKFLPPNIPLATKFAAEPRTRPCGLAHSQRQISLYVSRPYAPVVRPGLFHSLTARCTMQDIITLDYGRGRLKTAQLIDELIVPAFANTSLSQLGDGAVLPALEGPPVFSTDSFVVSPWRFPGGDIGKLAVCGTVNDPCMAGGAPR